MYLPCGRYVVDVLLIRQVELVPVTILCSVTARAEKRRKLDIDITRRVEELSQLDKLDIPPRPPNNQV